MCGLARLWILSVSDFQILPISQLGKPSDLFIDTVRDLSPFVTSHAFCTCSLGMLQCCWVPICGKCLCAAHLRCTIEMVIGHSLHLLSVMLSKNIKHGWRVGNGNTLWLNTRSLFLLFTQKISRGHILPKVLAHGQREGYKTGCQLKRVISDLK